MASSHSASPGPHSGPNAAFRQLRGQLSPGEFAAAVRRAAREIGEQVACDARYVGRVESGEIRCPNYAYERVFLYMFPGWTLTDMGFAPRETVRGRAPRSTAHESDTASPNAPTPSRGTSVADDHHTGHTQHGASEAPNGITSPSEPTYRGDPQHLDNLSDLHGSGATGALLPWRLPSRGSAQESPATGPGHLTGLPSTPNPVERPSHLDRPEGGNSDELCHRPHTKPDTHRTLACLADLAESRDAGPNGPEEPNSPDCTDDPASPASPASLKDLGSLEDPESPNELNTTAATEYDEESDVFRRAFMTGGSAALAAVPLGGYLAGAAHAAPSPARAGEREVSSVESAVRRIRVLDDQHGGDGLYRRAGDTLNAAHQLLDAGTHRQSTSDRLHASAGELAISVGWLAHDSGRLSDARSHYAEALATARVAGDPALEAHAFCNTAFLARDADRPREAVRAAQAGQLAAKHLGSGQLLSLLALREAGGWARLGDRSSCQEALTRAGRLFAHGTSDTDPEWMSFFGQAELAGLQAQCWSALSDWKRAAECARRAVALQNPHFARNTALFTAELAGNLAAQGELEEAAAAGSRALNLLEPVRSSRILGMLDTTAHRLRAHQHEQAVAGFLERYRRKRRHALEPVVGRPA